MVPKKLRSVNGQVLVDPILKEERKTAAGIVIPEINSKEARRRPEKGKVVLVDDPTLKAGETVFFPPNAGLEVMFGDKAYRIIPVKQLLLVDED